ncbi:MAG: SUMF1/EgtB/PvdO family nonheme iron enzyme, partial [Chloroflexi bacterium]|nr:SUMF1/EgtB/PvdO family nonheme iron enzyme [Chloroflexota bacterium]
MTAPLLQTPTPPAPTATPVSPCPPFLQPTCIWSEAVKDERGISGLLIILLAIGAILCLWYLGRGLLSRTEDVGKSLPEMLASWLRSIGARRRYLRAFLADNGHFGFQSVDEALSGKPVKLSDGYINLNLELERQPGDAGESKTEELEGLPAARGMRLEGEKAPLHIHDAAAKWRKIAIIGDAGSGKSALLQWLGLAAANRALWKRNTSEQRRALAALGFRPWLRPLTPVLIPLREYSRYCREEKKPRNGDTLADFLNEYGGRQYKRRKLPSGFFYGLLRRGCLLMFDGVDEVQDFERKEVRLAIEGLLADAGNHRRNRYLVTSRPSAASEAALVDFHHALVQPLSPEDRRQLIHLWCRVYYSENKAEEEEKKLTRRVESEMIRTMAQTPLMVNIFALVHFHRRELPNQRAELFEYAIQALLTGVHRRGQAEDDAETWGGMKWQQRRDTLALVAFLLHDKTNDGEGGLLADELICQPALWSRFGTESESAQASALDFLEKIARGGGLLRQDGRHFDFYIRRFREFLAGRYLAAKLEDEWEARLLRHALDDWWEEPIQLAAGFLSFTNLDKAQKYLLQLTNLRGSQEQNARAVTLAGLALADLLGGQDPQVHNVLAGFKKTLPARMRTVFETNPPLLAAPLRRRLGLALGAAGDPRLDALQPRMVSVPAGRFRMGSSPQDVARLEAQNVRVWDDEKTAGELWLTLSAYQIGRFPLSNQEFRVFWNHKGYENKEWWSDEGWAWRQGDWQPDVSVYGDEYRKAILEWLEGRRKDRRGQPFFWDDPQWNAPNLPVVGVTWFEAEAYCKWLSARTGRTYQLPTEAQWEKAARGENGLLWPWSDAWDAGRCNSDEGEKFARTTPVGMYPHGESPCGARDMAGNVWEWCRDWFHADAYARPLENLEPSGARGIRGGSW